MNELKTMMLKTAMERYRTITPCSAKRDFSECFTVEGNKLCLWFNTEDNTTHLIFTEILG